MNSMSPEFVVVVVGAASAVAGALVLIISKVPKRIKQVHYVKRWRDIQRLCTDKSNWPQAIMLGDLLLDEVLKKKRKTGKSMGERLVAAQKDISNNDTTWQAHKLANHIRHTPDMNLKETDVKAALVAFRQALRDLGAL